MKRCCSVPEAWRHFEAEVQVEVLDIKIRPMELRDTGPCFYLGEKVWAFSVNVKPRLLAFKVSLSSISPSLQKKETK